MKWREVLLGAAASLSVTLVGGIVLFYFTKEPDLKKTERISYSIQQPAFFKGGSQDVAFSSVQLLNEGGVAAKKVAVIVEFKDAEIRDLSIEARSGARESTRQVSPTKSELTFDALLPGESVSINLLLTTPSKPMVTLRMPNKIS